MDRGWTTSAAWENGCAWSFLNGPQNYPAGRKTKSRDRMLANGWPLGEVIGIRMMRRVDGFL